MIVSSIASENQMEKFIEDFLTRVSNLPAKGIIGVDGATQCGKSKYVTSKLAKALKAKIIDLDTFIKIDNTDIIYKNISISISKNKWYIADGILNRKILEHYGLKPKFSIYVKKMVNYGWVDQDWLDEVFIKDYGENQAYLFNNIDKQIKSYHKEYDPTVNADYVLEITENYITQDFSDHN